MLKNIFTACLLLTAGLCFGQATVSRTAKLPNSDITESYSVLKSDKKIKQGDYLATANNVTLAQGHYFNGERAGIWTFFDPQGKLIQTFNYTDNQLTFADSADTRRLKYVMPRVKADDDVSIPVKIGGSYTLQPTFLPKTLTQTIVKDFGSLSTASFTHIYNLDNKGEILKHEVKVSTAEQSKTYEVDDSQMDPDLTRFAPAMVNNSPVASKVISTSQVMLANGYSADFPNSTFEK